MGVESFQNHNRSTVSLVTEKIKKIEKMTLLGVSKIKKLMKILPNLIQIISFLVRTLSKLKIRNSFITFAPNLKSKISKHTRQILPIYKEKATNQI
jgi:hypothetical protein